MKMQDDDDDDKDYHDNSFGNVDGEAGKNLTRMSA